MFRSDRDALAQEVEELRAERERLVAQNDAMREDLLSRRQGVPSPLPGAVYKREVSQLTPGERAALTRHGVQAFPMWAMLLLHFVTFGIFPLAYFSSLHGRLPKAERDDPTPARGFWFSFIPYFGIYWVIFNTARLVDRINLQFRLRGLPDRVPRTFMMVTAVLTVIPYVYFLIGPILWPFAVFFLQRAVNELAQLPKDGAPPTVAAQDAATAAPWVAPPRARVPLVKDLPGPDDMVEQHAAAEAEAQEALEALEARRAAR
jgi:hypothetical protein